MARYIPPLFLLTSSSLALLRAVRNEVGDQRVGLGLGDDPELDPLGEAAADLFVFLKFFSRGGEFC